MVTILKIFFVLLVLIFVVPMLWLLIKEIIFFFGGMLGVVYLGDGFGWFLLFCLFVGLIIWMLSN
jgi:hypothetical protein